MPDLNSLLKSATGSASETPKKKFSRGIRPDHVARGEVPDFSNQNSVSLETVLAENKQGTNREQIDNKRVTDPQSDLSEFQGGKNLKPNEIHNTNEKTAAGKRFTKNALEKQVTIRQQTDNKQLTSSIETALAKTVYDDDESPSAKKQRQKQVTNREQKGNKEVTEQITKGVQTENKQSTVERGSFTKQVTEQITDAIANRAHTDNKQDTILSFEQLRGHEANLLSLIFQNCRSRGSLLSGPLTLDQISVSLKGTKNTCKTIISRLVAKGFVARESGATGRGGFTRFRLTKDLYQSILIDETDNKEVTNRVQIDNKQGTQQVTERITNVPIVVVPNSLSLKTTNTTADQICFVIPNELSGMISRRQLSQFVMEEKISESELQMSLDAFAFDLRNKLISVKHTSNPVGLLIGAIKNNGGYNSLKFAEALKTEMKTTLAPQQAIQDSISDLKATEGWAKYQEMKTSSPEAFQALISKYEKQGLKGELLEEFGFLEFQAQQDVPLSEISNPLRPAGG